MKDIEFRAHDDLGYDMYYPTAEEAVIGAAHRSLNVGHCVLVDFLPYTKQAAKSVGIEDFDEEDSVSLRLRITCTPEGKIP